MLRLIICFLLTFTPVKAEKILTFHRGSDLIYYSETGDYPQLREIDGYLKGVLDAYSGISWCSKTKLTFEDLNTTISIYLYTHPKEWNNPARDIILNALIEKLPCNQ